MFYFFWTLGKPSSNIILLITKKYIKGAEELQMGTLFREQGTVTHSPHL